MGVSKPVVAGLQRSLDKRLEADGLKAQLRAYRGWLRLAKKHASPVGPQPSVVPGYARGGTVTEDQLAWANTPQPNLSSPVAPTGAGTGFDVIPGTGYQPEPTFTVDQPAPAPPPTGAGFGYDVIPGTGYEPQPTFTPDPFTDSVLETADRLNPAAAAYEDARGGDTALRPSNFSDQLRHRPIADVVEPVPKKKNLAQAFAPKGVAAQQRAAFGGLQPGTMAAKAFGKLSDDDKEALVILAGELEQGGATADDVMEYLQRTGGKVRPRAGGREPIAAILAQARETVLLLKEAKARVAAGADPQTEAQNLEATLRERETGGVRGAGPLGNPDLLKSFYAESFVPGAALNKVAEVPVIGKPLASAIQGSTTPLGAATLGRFGGGLKGIAKNTAAITGAGTAAAPLGPAAQQIAMTAADLAVGGPSGAPEARLATEATDVVPGLERKAINENVMTSLERDEYMRLSRIENQTSAEQRRWLELQKYAGETPPQGPQPMTSAIQIEAGVQPPRAEPLRPEAPSVRPPLRPEAPAVAASRSTAMTARAAGQVGEPQIKIRDAVDAEDVAVTAAEEDAISRSMDDILNEARKVCDTL